jgi:hypothetical protein
MGFNQCPLLGYNVRPLGDSSCPFTNIVVPIAAFKKNICKS